MLHTNAHLAIVVGGYNSSNTSHLVELCEEKLPTYFISNEEKIASKNSITHFLLHEKSEITSANFLLQNEPINILITSGASCPDAIVESVIRKLIGFYNVNKSVDEIIEQFA